MVKTQRIKTGSWGEDTTSEASVKILRPLQKNRHAVLRQQNGPDAPCDWSLAEPKIILGRSSSAQISIDASDLSRQHLRIELIDDDFHCTDLDSVNGLFLNGIKVHSCTLRRGDTIQAGKISFIFEEVEA